MSTFDKRMATATHESAHAIAARAGGMTVNEVVLLGDTRGFTDFRATDDGWPLLVAIVAGPVADVLVGHKPMIPFEARLASARSVGDERHDELQAWGLARKFSTSDDEALGLVCEAQRAATTFISDHIDAVRQLADLLYQRGRLSGEDLNQLFEPSPASCG